MARSKNGGRPKGKIGNKVFTTWNGIEVVKSAPVKTAPPTEKQKLNQWVFKLTQDWLNPISAVVKIGFKGYTQTYQGFTAAKSYLSKNALIKDGYDSTIDPSRMLVSYGSLPGAENVQVELDEQKELVFTWDTSLTREMDPLDQVILLAYNTEEKQAISSLGGNFRKAGTAGISLANATPGEFHIYMAFVARDSSRQSNSEYLGSISIAD